MNAMIETIDLKVCSLCRYKIVPEKFYQPELGEYHTYGVQIQTPGYTGILHDVSVCKKTSERIVKLLNHHKVSPVHFYDIITDMIP